MSRDILSILRQKAGAAQGYDALHILAKAVKFTGFRNPLDLPYAIRYMDVWEGANGRYKFDGTGELEDKPIFVKMFQRGVPVAIRGGEPVSNPVIIDKSSQP